MTSRYQLYVLTTELHTTPGELGHVTRYFSDMSRIYYKNQAIFCFPRFRVLAIFRGVRNCFRHRTEFFSRVENYFFTIITFLLLYRVKHCFLRAGFN